MPNFINNVQHWGGGQTIGFSSNQNNILIESSVVYFEPSVDNLEITGFDSGLNTSSMMLWCMNRSAYNTILKHNSSSSSAENRIIIEGGNDYIISAGSQLFLLYDNSKWNLFYTPVTPLTGLLLPSNGAVYYGDPDTDGSVRTRWTGTSFVTEKRDSGSWVAFETNTP